MSDTRETDAGDFPEDITKCTASKAFIDGITEERDKALLRFEALKEFCEVELSWMYFRAEFLSSKADSTSKTIENARALQAYLKELK